MSATHWRDQLHETGHEVRDSDIERLQALGVQGSRYPVLWEKIATASGCDFRWTDRRLDALRKADIEPIVTLVHHGSGPVNTDLLDPLFPERLAAFALEAAKRYPWIRRWTPINEPLTTARFSTLYAAWYPNRYFDHAAFGAAITNEAHGTQLAMRAIRSVIPGAELVLTDDLQGFSAGDDGAKDYAAHKAERRYLSAELVMGRVGPDHAMWRYLTGACGVPTATLERLRRRQVQIDVMGWNYYPYSERVLFSGATDDMSNLPLVEVAPERLDCRARLREAYTRLGVPSGLSEVHVIGNEYERARWMLQRFEDVQALRAEGADICVFGAWAAFGMVDWNSLLRETADFREDGIYTFAAGNEEPQRTLVADVVRSLSSGQMPAIPQDLGWWERPRSAVA